MMSKKYSLILMPLLIALAIGCSSKTSTPSPMDFAKELEVQGGGSYKIKNLKKVDAVMSTVEGVQHYTIQLGGEVECLAPPTCKKGQIYELNPKRAMMELMKTEKGWKYMAGYIIL